ncbi:hypothetical protein OIM68_18565, partial [Escherichia coli]|nr:hypothetical protein [Escherichia coli]
GTADRNRSHWSTSKTPSYTKSVSWQHHHRVFIGKLCVIATLPSVIRKRRTGILINIISLGTGIFYNQYDELNIIFFIRVI